AATVFGPVQATGNAAVMILVYNTLAFSTQCFVGLAADRIRRHVPAAAIAMALTSLGFLLPLPAWVRVALIGLGNSVFHVAAGAATLEQSGGKAWPLGVFVGPGAVGLTLGTLWPQAGGAFAALLLLCAAISVFLPRENRTPAREKSAAAPLLVPVLLTIAVAVRAIGGSAAVFPWKAGAAAALVLSGAVFAGKCVGGLLCDRIGARRCAWISVVPAAMLIAFCAAWAWPSLLGQFLLNLTMPVTLWLLWKAMPDAPGFAFGLAASALWPGMLAGQLLTLTGPALWICVLGCFGFGLCIILYAERKI
ncbi:MAG: hypothetical protein II621_07460, partial [Clostridia bacterium]|nr:hypothetical protein [Clostridia bacterium]